MANKDNVREVTISRSELQEAISMYAAAKAKMKYPLNFRIKLNGELILMGGDSADAELFCTVTLEHLPNVHPLKGKDRG